jgi:hypothetical protein
VAFDIKAVPQVLWKCPLCNTEEGLRIQSEGLVFKKHQVYCASCNAKWDDASKNGGMTLIKGPAEHLGFKSIDDWYKMVDWGIQLMPISVSLPVLMKKDETVFKVGRADYYKPRRRKGSEFIDHDDIGEFILTNKRLVFNGNKKPFNMELKKIIAMDVENGFLEVGYGQKTHLFRFPSESMLKWKAYAMAAVQEFVSD